MAVHSPVQSHSPSVAPTTTAATRAWRHRRIRFSGSRLTASVIAVVIATVMFGGVAESKLMAATQSHQHVSNTAADLSFDLNTLNAVSREAIMTPGPSDLGVRLADAERSVLTEMRSLEASGVDRADMAALGVRVRSLVADLHQEVAGAADSGVAVPQVVVDHNQALYVDLDAKIDLEIHEVRSRADQAARQVKLLTFGLGAFLLVVVGSAIGLAARRRRQIDAWQAESRSLARFEAMVEHGSDLLTVTSRGGDPVYVSPTLENLLGYQVDSTTAMALAGVVDPKDRPMLSGLLDQARSMGRAGPADYRIRHADGSWRVMEVTLVDLTDVTEVAGVLWSARDVTERRELEHELERSAFSDSLTGLANRALFRERLDHAVALTGRGHGIAVLLADLDDFKTVNDSLGHDIGDEVLVEVAARLTKCVRPGDTVARLGGDEFAVILEDSTGQDGAERIAERMLQITRLPFRAGGTELRIGLSIGVAHAHGSETGPELLRNADTAMYSAKSNGRNRWALFEMIMHRKAEDRLRLASDLDDAVTRGELEVHYQPVIVLATGEIGGVEALLRWHHPTRGLISPATFIPVAEETGQIVTIGNWVMRQACLQASRWHAEFPTQAPLNVSINVSGRQLAEPSLGADVRTILAETAIDPATVILEITESVLMQHLEIVQGKLLELKSLGVRLAIDDFGTGYSSLAYLREFPVDILKIDRVFIEAASSGAAGGEALVRSIVDLSASLHLATVAEGIEHQEQADLMRALGCNTAQGFLFARPMAPDQLRPLLANRQPMADRSAT